MIRSYEFRKVQKYLDEHFPIRTGEMDYYDKIIYSIPEGAPYSQLTDIALEQCITELESRMVTEVMLHSAITPLAVCYAERLQQMKVTQHRLKGIDATKDLALLCFALSFDFEWVQKQADQIDFDKERAELQAEAETTYRTPAPSTEAIIYGIEEDELPF